MHRLKQAALLALAVTIAGCQVTTGPARDGSTKIEPETRADGKRETCTELRSIGTKAANPKDVHCVIYYADGSAAIGRYRRGREHGTWIYVLQDGTKRTGEWRNGKRVGDWSWHPSHRPAQRASTPAPRPTTTTQAASELGDTLEYIARTLRQPCAASSSALVFMSLYEYRLNGLIKMGRVVEYANGGVTADTYRVDLGDLYYGEHGRGSRFHQCAQIEIRCIRRAPCVTQTDARTGAVSSVSKLRVTLRYENEGKIEEEFSYAIRVAGGKKGLF